MATTKELYRLRSPNMLIDNFASSTSRSLAPLNLKLIQGNLKVHSSACGRHYVALLSECPPLVMYNFEKVSSKEGLYNQTLNIQLTSFDYGRILVITVSKGSFSSALASC